MSDNICDVPNCANKPIYACSCRRCLGKLGHDQDTFYACAKHVKSDAVDKQLLDKHCRIYPGHTMQLYQYAPKEGAVSVSAASVAQLISAECDAVKEMLLKKNESYGNSFAEPIGIFAKGLSVDAQIRVRIDDKLSRLAKGGEFAGDDTALDLIGYLVLFRVVQKMRGQKEE